MLRRGLPLIAIAVTGSIAALLLVSRADRPAPVVPVDVAEQPRLDDPHAPIDAPPTPVTRSLTVRRVPARDAALSATREREVTAADDEEPAEIRAEEYIAALRDSGETGGLAAFPPPGTRPPRPGVIVPDDYELPEGFARHYQTTDDGRRLAPILAVAPGYELLDAAGEPVPLIDDRIVPPEFAPPDLPVQLLEIPSEQDAR
jgi:hypothetical protein